MTTKWMAIGSVFLTLMLLSAVLWVEVIDDNPLSELSTCVAQTDVYPDDLYPALRTLESNLLRADVLDGRTKAAYRSAFQRAFRRPQPDRPATSRSSSSSDATGAAHSSLSPSASSPNARSETSTSRAPSTASVALLCTNLDHCRALRSPQILSAYPHCFQDLLQTMPSARANDAWTQQARIWARFTETGRLRESDVLASIDAAPDATFADGRLRLAYALTLFQVQTSSLTE